MELRLRTRLVQRERQGVPWGDTGTGIATEWQIALSQGPHGTLEHR